MIPFGNFTTCIAHCTAIVINLAIGIYSAVLYSKLSPVNTNSIGVNSGTCMASTTLNLLLAVCILQFSLIVMNVFGIVIETYASFFQNDEPAQAIIVRVCIAFQAIGTTLIGLALLALIIAMSVFVWRDQCSILNADASSGYFFAFMQIYLIIYWTVPVVLGLMVTIVICFMYTCWNTILYIFCTEEAPGGLSRRMKYKKFCCCW